MLKRASLNFWLATFLAVTFVSANAAEFLRPVSLPQNEIRLGAIADLQDDIYSADGHLFAELALRNRVGIFLDGSYRFVSCEFNTKLHQQIHEIMFRDVNGLNSSLIGLEIFPFIHYGFAFAYTIPATNGETQERFPQMLFDLQAVFPFSRRMSFGYAFEYLTYQERTNYQPGDELGAKASLEWNLGGLYFSYVFLYRHRIEQSLNYNLAKPYQKMKDAYQGIRMLAELSWPHRLKLVTVDPGVSYQITKGTLFGFETGHRMEFFLRLTR